MQDEGTYKGRILVIDDTVAIIDMVRTALENSGYYVLAATSGQNGLKSAQLSSPDLILLDVMMPEQDGFSVCHQLKQIPLTQHIPVIFLSALVDPQDKVKAFQMGAVDYITKPIHVDELLARVATQISLHQMQKKLQDTNAWLEQEVNKRTAELRESQQKYRTVADFTYDWEYWLLPDKTIAYMSPSCREITGYTIDDFQKNPDLLNQIVDNEDKEVWNEHLAKEPRFIEGKRELIFKIITKSGEAKWIGHTCSRVLTEDGVYNGIRVGNRDITELVNAELKLQAKNTEYEAINAELHERNEELTAVQEELRTNIESLYKSNDKLAESQERYKMLTGHMPDKVLTVNRDFIITYANRSILGLQPEELVGRSILTLNEDYTREYALKSSLETAFKTRQSKSFKREYQVKDKPQKFNIRLCPMVQNDEVKELLYIITDVTKEQELEFSLAKSENALKNLIKSTIGKQGQAYFENLSITLSEITKASYLFIASLSENSDMCTVSLISKNCVLDNITFPLLDSPCDHLSKGNTLLHEAEGEITFFNDYLSTDRKIKAYVGTPINNHQNKPIGILVALFEHFPTDTNLIKSIFELSAGKIAGEMERVNAEMLLRKSEERFDLAMKANHDGLFDWNLQTNTVYYSHGWKKIIGYEDHEVEGTYDEWERLAHREDISTTWEKINEHLSGQTDHFEAEFKMLHKNGHYVDILARGNAIFDENHKPIRLIGTHTDITQRKKLEQELKKKNEQYQKMNIALKRSEERLDLSVKGAQLALWDWNVQSGETVFNERWAEIIGYTLKELEPVNIDTWLKFCHPDDLEKSNIELQKHFNGETTHYSCEVRMQHKNGQWIWVHDRGKLFEWTDDGKPLRMSGTHVDITERKISEEKLLASEYLLRRSQSVGNIGSWEYNAADNSLTWTDQVYRIYGYEPESFKPDYQFFLSMIHPHDREKVNQAFENSIQTGAKGYEVEHRIIMPETTEVKLVSEKCEHIYDDKGNLIKSIGIIQDITDQRKNERILDNFFNQPMNLHMVASLDATIHKVNEGWKATLGYEINELIGQKFYDFIHPDDVKKTLEEMDKLAEGQKSFYFENRYRQKSGAYRTMAWSAIASLEDELVYAVASDITERKHAENIRSAQLKLVEFSSSHNVKELLQKFLDEAEALTESNVGFYHFLDESQEMVTLQAWSSNTLEAMCATEGEDMHYPISQAGVWVDCVKEMKPVIHNDYVALPHKKGLPEGHAPIVRELVVPVIRDKKVVAILGVGNKATKYDKQDIGTIQSLADLAWETVVRRKAEETIKVERQRLKDIIEGTGIGTWEWIYKTGELFVNEKYTAMLGYTVEEFGHSIESWERTVHPDDLPDIKTTLERHFNSQADFMEKVYRQIHKDGHIVWIQSRAKVVGWDKNGSPVKVSGTHQDITRRIIAQEKLKQSEERLQLIFDNSPAIMMLLNENTQILMMNKTGQTYTAKSNGEIQYKQPGDVLDCVVALKHPNGCGHSAQCKTCVVRNTVLQSIKEKQSFYKVETKITVVKNNIPIDLDVLVSSVVATTHPETTYLVTMDDITEQKRSQRALEESEERHKLISQLHTDYVYSASLIDDSKFKLDWVSGGFEKMSGYKPGNFSDLFEYWKLVVHPDDIEEFLQLMLHVGDDPLIRHEHRILTKDGNIKWVREYILTIYGDRNRVSSIVGSVRDITDRKLSEEKLKDSELKFRTVVTSSDAITWMLDEKGNFTLSEGKGLEVIGLKPGQIVGMNAFELYKDYPEIIEGFRQAFEGKAFSKTLNLDGYIFQVYFTPYLIPGTKKLRGVVGVSLNVTEKYSAEMDIKKKQEELNELNQKMAEYKLSALRSAMNPHFVFNCLNSIQMFVAKSEREQAINYLSLFSKLIRGVLESSISQKISLENELAVLQYYIELEKMRFSDKFEVIFDIDPDLDIENIRVPSLFLQPYVENAILHGLSHKKSEGLLLISLKEEDNLLTCTIEDNGIGREASAILNEKKRKGHKSVGMSMTEERLNIINRTNKLSVHTEDLFDNAQPTGTRVHIQLDLEE